jgi:signal transduction histidine kinase
VNLLWIRRILYVAAGAAILLLAYWLRNPLIPYGGDTPRASANSESDRRRADAMRALERAIVAEQRRLAQLAASALDAPEQVDPAFEYLRNTSKSGESGVVLLVGGQPFAWDGQFRNTPQFTGIGTSVRFSPFYVSLQVAAATGSRIAIASALVHAEPPANRIASGLDAQLAGRNLVESLRFVPLSDSTAGDIIAGAGGNPLFRVEVVPTSDAMVVFARTASLRAKGAVVLAILIVLLIALAWTDRRALWVRLTTLAIAMAAVAVVPWNNFSNFSRAFDPAFFYSALGGPLTRSSGPFAMTSAILVLAVIALIRARRTGLTRSVAALAGVVAAVGGFAVTENAARGIVVPLRGATASLWIEWQIPLFLLLFAFWLAAAWLLRIAMGRRPMVELRSAAVIALACGAVATFIVWTKTTEQRLQLAMRDVAALQRTDAEATQLLTRFGAELSDFDSAGTRADLLKRYARSDLAAAGLQVSLGSWKGDTLQSVRIAELPYNDADLAAIASEAIKKGEPVVKQSLGPTGRQVMLAAPHRAGGATTAVATPRTRLVAENPYIELLGFDQPDKSEPPYTLVLSDIRPEAGAKQGTMTWRRVGNEWHGDEVLLTALGPSRAHVEIDLRTWPTRIVRAALIVILDVAVAGILWALATMAEGGFFRWIRTRASRWLRSYRGRLTLALFAFFVIPAVGFAVWSYQRLQRDDRGVRELLVREILNARAQGATTQSDAEPIGGAPLFVYTDGILSSSTDSLYAMIAAPGRLLPRRVYVNITQNGELTASARRAIGRSTMFWGYRAVSGTEGANYVLAAPARSDELVLDRRRRDLTLLVLFATAVGGIAAFWLSGIAARVLARDLELSRIEVARAERVLAWGEMARQIAHEIKNPLTPIRLGVQHLRRAKADPRVDFDKVLEENVARILSEIDRLDKIARTFSRYGTAPGELPPAETVDVAAILHDVIALERMGIGGIDWTLEGVDTPVLAEARKDELRDVLLNVFENARLARARSVHVRVSTRERNVTVEISDDGAGIARAALPRVFEPHFSTRTTGSGLGLAISRRLLESWGGTIDLESDEGKGAHVTITLQAGA